jgi:hypothetical protein
MSQFRASAVIGRKDWKRFFIGGRLRSETNRQPKKTFNLKTCGVFTPFRRAQSASKRACCVVCWHTIATRHQRGEAQGWALHAECSV